MKRARSPSPDPRQALHPEFADSLDESLRPLSCRKHACTLFNQGIRRKPISALNGPGWHSAHSNTNKDLRNICLSNNIFQSQTFHQGRTEDFSPRKYAFQQGRTQTCGLFNGALPHYGSTGAYPHLVDKDGHVLGASVQDLVVRQQHIGGRFLVLGEVGRGAFGACLKGWDTGSKSFVAIKMVRRGHRHHVDAEMEAEKLQILRWRDRDHMFVVSMVSSFQYNGHFCLVTELLGTTLHSALRQLCKRGTGRTGVAVETARRLSFQLCQILQFLYTSRLIHADLKTENICLEKPGKAVVLIHSAVILEIICFFPFHMVCRILLVK